jgi:hypothetical protein
MTKLKSELRDLYKFYLSEQEKGLKGENLKLIELVLLKKCLTKLSEESEA